LTLRRSVASLARRTNVHLTIDPLAAKGRQHIAEGGHLGNACRNQAKSSSLKWLPPTFAGNKTNLRLITSRQRLFARPSVPAARNA
jgi:hypothetical protein